jgi:RimJ/RimL family protein N-acetyltransferase
MIATAAAGRAMEQPVTTPSGAEFLVRPLRPDDVGELAAGFGRLSARARYQRFLTGTPNLSAAQLAYLTQIDHHDHEALVAVTPATGEIIGVARFVRSRSRPDSAEIAVTIADEWQRRGVGTELLRRLVDRALQEGIVRFTAEILSENDAMLALAPKAGRVTVEVDGGMTAATIALERRLAH